MRLCGWSTFAKLVFIIALCLTTITLNVPAVAAQATAPPKASTSVAATGS